MEMPGLGEMAQGVKTLAVDSHNPQATWQKRIYYCQCGCQCVPSTHKINECNENKFERSGNVYNQIPVAIYKKAKPSKNLRLR